MIIKLFISITSLLLLAACSSTSIGPLSAGQDSYVVSKHISSFTTKEENSLTAVFAQANEYCLNQNRFMKVIHLNEHIGLIGNEAKTTLVFSCLNESMKVEKVVERVVERVVEKPAPVVKQQHFIQKGKLMNYAF